jgi:hypothetical protein
LEVGVAINGRRIEPLELSWSAPAAAPIGELAVLRNAATTELLVVDETAASEPMEDVEAVPVERAEATASQKPPPGNTPAFRRVAASALDQHRGSPLRITTRNGRVVKGDLLSLSGNGLRLRQALGNGEAILPITFDRIDFVEVFY